LPWKFFELRGVPRWQPPTPASATASRIFCSTHCAVAEQRYSLRLVLRRPGAQIWGVRGVLVRWLVSAVALWLTSSIVAGVQVRGVGSLLLAAAMIGVINAVVRPVVLLLTLPLSIVTFGLFVLVVNASMLALASVFVPGFEVQGFWAALWGWLLLS